MASLGKLAAGVAHELNNPLGFIRANIETLTEYTGALTDLVSRYRAACDAMMRDGAVPPPGFDAIEHDWEEHDVEFIIEDSEDMLRETMAGADRATELVSALKVFARNDSPDTEALDVNRCVGGALLIVNNELKYHCTVVKVFGELPPVTGNSTRLSQVFVNILLNAAHAIPENGTVEVRTWAEAGTVNVSIKDDGVGMDADTRALMFEPFFTTRDEPEGKGLGLAVARETVREFGGSVHVGTAPGAGTKVTISLPARV